MSKGLQIKREEVRDLIASIGALAPVRQMELRSVAIRAITLARALRDPLLEAEASLALHRPRAPLVFPAQSLAAFTSAERVFVAHRLPQRAAASRLAQAHALADMGHEQRAVDLALRTLGQGGLDLDDQLHGHVIVAMAELRLGHGEAACRRLHNPGIAIAASSGRPDLLSRLLWAQAQAKGLWLWAHHLPDFWQPLLAMPLPATPPPPPVASVLNLLARSDALLDGYHPWQYNKALACVLRGLFLDHHAADEQLSKMALNWALTDPPLAARTLLALSLLRRVRGQPQRALESLGAGEALTRRYGCTAILRDVLQQLAHVHEVLGDPAAALRATRELSRLAVEAVRSEAPSLPDGSGDGPSDGVDTFPATATPAWATPIASTDGNALRPRQLEPAYLKRALRYIDSHLGKRLAVLDIAGHCGVARRTLEQAFRDFRSTSVAEFVSNQRMTLAAQVLTMTQEPIQAVASQAGFGSASAFARKFRARYGAAPADWRRVQQQGCTTD